MSRLTPAEHTAYRDRIAAATTVPATMAVIKEAAAAALRPAPAALVSVRRPVAAATITDSAPAAGAPSPGPVAAIVKQDGSDIVALARAAGLGGFKQQTSSAAQSKTFSDHDVVALARSAGLAGFKRQEEEQTQ